MKTVLDTSDRPAHDALVEKKSEFIADVCHVDALDEALLFVDSVRQLHPKARHVAYAAICVDGDGRVRERMSDDGEPSGVKVARLASIETCRRYTTALQYPQFDVFRQLASDCGAALENERYSDRVVLDTVVPVEREREFLRRVRETFSATVTPESGELISRPVAI